MSEHYSDRKYESYKIPKCSKKEEDQSLNPIARTNQIPINYSQDCVFYEIEYDAGWYPDDGKYVMRSAKIEPPPKDEIRERFNQMRDIARANRSFYSGSNKFYDSKVQREKAKIFYKQGMFMKDFEDYYEESVPYSSYYPFYQMMGYEQLRTYFTWRTKVRKGIVEETSLSYAFLYIYELLNNIGVDTPEAGLEKLMLFWKEFRNYEQTVDKYVLKWLKDYHVYYDMPQTFKEFIILNNLGIHYPQIVNSGDDFDLLCSVSKYDIRKSVFYTKDHVELINGCFYCVRDRIRQAFEEAGIDYDGSVFLPGKNMAVWEPFKDALFFPWLRQRDRRVVLSESEIYVCDQNSWKFSKVFTSESGRKFLGYIMKQTEAVLREVTKCKYRITASASAVNPVTVSMLEAVGISLEKLITDTVREYYREKTKTVVRVNPDALNKIRQEALVTQEKLIVEEVPEQDVGKSNLIGTMLTENLDGQKLMEADIVEWVPEKEKSAEQILMEPDWTGRMSGEIDRMELGGSESWDGLKLALNNTELEALVYILQGKNHLKQYADLKGIMLEVLVDGINEKAMDFVGDSILNDGFTVYEDYEEEVKEMVRDI